MNQIEDVKRFVNIMMSKPFDVDLVSGKYVVNAKSIMGIFSLDLAKPIWLQAECDEEAAFLDEIRDFLTEA